MARTAEPAAEVAIEYFARAVQRALVAIRWPVVCGLKGQAAATGGAARRTRKRHRPGSAIRMKNGNLFE